MSRAIPRTLVTVLFTICIWTTARAQFRFYDVWHFGNRVGPDFTSGSPVLAPGSMTAFEACASICDRWTGEFLLYTNGDTVWNRNHAIVRNATGLNGNFSASQGTLIVPHPGDSLQYYIFTLDGVTVGRQRPFSRLGLYYSIVDFSTTGRAGDMTVRNVSLLPSASEQLVAVRRLSGCGYRIVTYEIGTNRFFAWHLSPFGLADRPVISEIGPAFDLTERGYLKASPDGSMLIGVRGFQLSAELFSFDAFTGRVTKQLADLPRSTEPASPPATGFCISPTASTPDATSYGTISGRSRRATG